MIEITNKEERCHMMRKNGCSAMRKTDCKNCNFYKPHDCQDQIRIVKGSKVFLYQPEELGLIRCSECKYSRADEKSDIHWLCIKHEGWVKPLWGYCSQGEKRKAE